MDSHEDNADRRYLKQAIEQMKATLKEKELMEQAERDEESRFAEEVLQARSRKFRRGFSMFGSCRILSILGWRSASMS